MRVQHFYPGGHLMHHLFVGVLIVIPAAFLLAFGTRVRFLAISARVALGIGSAMILDEIAYLVVTKATDQDYVSRVSFLGAVAFIFLAVVFLWILTKSPARWMNRTPSEPCATANGWGSAAVVTAAPRGRRRLAWAR